MASSGGPPPEESPCPSEDTVECRLYSLIKRDHDIEQELCIGAMKYSQFLKELTCDYIWYHEELRVSVSRGGYVTVCVTFRDGIEDEWYLVSLMCRLTETFTDLVVSISDSDGEFLLIEAAHHLPLWLKPETSTNRVFIHGGRVHIIPKPTNPAEILHYPVATPTLQQALSLVRSETCTEASSLIQEAIDHKIKQQLHSPHFTHCYVPIRVAHVLHHNKQLVAATVHAVCDRDMIDMKACRKMTTFPVDKCIMTGVTFTRRLYAQLLREQFQAPRNAGFHHYGSGTAYDLGIKLTCGFEMLMSSLRQPTTAGCVSDSDPLWLQLISSLEQKGYFQGQLEGSELYNELKEKAKHFYKESMVEDNRGPRLIHAEHVHHIITDVPIDEHQLEHQNLPPPDSDDWLEITPAQLDHMIYETQRVTKGAGLDSVVNGMASFIDHVSSYEGVEFPSYLLRELQLSDKDEYVAECILVETISELLTYVVAAGVKHLDAVVCYHVMVDALDSCALHETTQETLTHFLPLLVARQHQFVAPHAYQLVQDHMIRTVMQHFYLYHVVLTEERGVATSTAMAMCHTPTRESIPPLKEGIQEDQWNKQQQLSQIEQNYQDKKKQLYNQGSCDQLPGSHDQPLDSHDQPLTRQEVEVVTKRLLGNMMSITTGTVHRNIEEQELTVDMVAEKFQVLKGTTGDEPSSSAPSRRSTHTSKQD